jgi:hypothetical protein
MSANPLLDNDGEPNWQRRRARNRKSWCRHAPCHHPATVIGHLGLFAIVAARLLHGRSSRNGIWLRPMAQDQKRENHKRRCEPSKHRVELEATKSICQLPGG